MNLTAISTGYDYVNILTEKLLIHQSNSNLIKKK